MEAVLEEALKSFVTDVLSVDRPCSELSLKIFFIFKNIVGSTDHGKEEDIFCMVKSHLIGVPEIKERLGQQEQANKCVQILRGQILIRLFFTWVARDCLKKDLDNDPELKNVVEEVTKLCEMFCIRTDPLQLNAFLSETVTRMFVDYVPDILACIFDEFLLPLPKELAATTGNDQMDDSPSDSRSPQDREQSNDNELLKRKSCSRSQSRRPMMSPIRNVDNNSSAGRPNNRFGKRPSRQILVASRSSAVVNSAGDKKTKAGQQVSSKQITMVSSKSISMSSDRRFSVRSQSFDLIGAGLRQQQAPLQRSTLSIAAAPVAAPTNDQKASQAGSVRRCLFSDPSMSDAPTQIAARPGYTTPRKRSSAVVTSIADTPPMDRKQSKIAPMTPLSKQFENSPNSFKPDLLSSVPALTSSSSFRIPTTPLRQLQQSLGSPKPGAVLVPQSPDDSKAGIAARSFYTKSTAPQSVTSLAKKSVLTNSNRRTLSSYDFGGSCVQSSNDTTHFLFTELMTMSPTTGVTESSVTYGSKGGSCYGFFPPAELDISPRACRVAPVIPAASQSALLGSPVIESRSSRRTQQQSQLASPFSVAAGYTCE